MDIPAIITVQAHKIHQWIYLAAIRTAALLQCASQRTVLYIQFSCSCKYRCKIIMGKWTGGLCLIENTPCKNTRMILITNDHLLHCLQMMFLQLLHMIATEKSSVTASCSSCQIIRKAAHQTNRRNFVNDQEAFLICHLIPLLRIRIMAGTETVGVNPFQALIISLGNRIVEAFAQHIAVFMLSKALQIYFFTTDPELIVLDLHGTDTDLGTVLIHRPHCGGKSIQIRIADFPQMGFLHFQCSFFSLCLCHDLALGVTQRNRNRSFPIGHNLIMNQCILTIQLVIHGIILDRFRVCLHQPYTSVNSTEIKEIKIWCIDLSSGSCGFNRSTWHTGLI